jgi:hypothetical protein
MNAYDSTRASGQTVGFTPNPDNPIPIPGPDLPFPWPDEPILPPIDWACRFHGPVSGRYEGGRAGIPSILGSVLDLRVDVDPRYANSPVLNRVSGDVFTWRVGGGRIVGPFRTFTESWIVDAPAIRWYRCRVEISGAVRYWRGSHPATTVNILIPFSSFSTGPATVTFTTPGGGTSIFSCTHRSNAFREVTLETDYCASVQAVPQLPSYDTTWHNTRPPGTPQRVLTVAEAYREAGVALTTAPAHTIIDDSAPGFASWSVAELHDSMEVAFSQFPASWPRWNLWGLLAGTFDDPLTGGIMFDAGAIYGGSGEPPERQGFAVFRNHSWFTNLRDGVPTTQAEAAAMRHFLYTWVHEAGHAFNFLHSWNKSRPDALSWMNYDWRYDNRNGVDSFWSNFRFRFDDEELLHMRHGDRVSVIMGGDPWASGGHLESPPEAFAQSDGEVPVELLLRSQGFFDFMEPVTVELRLRNTSSVPIEIDARLTPEFGSAGIYIRRPDGRIVMYAPLLCKLGDPVLRTLEPAEASNTGKDRYSELISLVYGGAGFSFDEPGDYLVRAVYHGLGLTLSSNTLKVRVGRPMTRDEDRFAMDFFTHPVGMTLYVEGSQSPFLAKGMDCLQEAAEQFAGSTLSMAAAKTVARSVGRSFYRRKDNGPKLMLTHKADAREALKLTAPSIGFYREHKRKAFNLPYHQLVRERAALLTQVGARDQASAELQNLRSDLQAREVHPPVLAAIKSYEDSLK